MNREVLVKKSTVSSIIIKRKFQKESRIRSWSKERAGLGPDMHGSHSSFIETWLSIRAEYFPPTSELMFSTIIFWKKVERLKILRLFETCKKIQFPVVLVSAWKNLIRFLGQIVLCMKFTH